MLIANLLQKCSAEEIAKVRKDFRLPERSRLLFERIVSAPSSPPEATELCKAFHISKENLYRLFSEIVDECVRILAPKEEFAPLKFFKSKYLYRSFITEAQRIEKRLLGERDRPTLEQFYKFVFLNIASFPSMLIDVGHMEKFGSKWYKAKENPPPDDELAIRMKVVFTQIAALPAKKKMNLEQMSEYSRDLLDRYSHMATVSPNPHVRHEYFQAEWKACAYRRTEASIRLKWLENSLAVIREHPSDFEKDMQETVELQIAYELALFNEKPKEALEIYLKYYRGQTPETTQGAFYLVRLIRVAFLARDFQTAHRVLAELIGHQVSQATPYVSIHSLLIKAMLEVTEGLVDATKTIETARTINRENYSLGYEVQIRGLESANALKQGDYELADQLVDRNIKWLRSKQIALSKSSWIYFYQIIGAIIRYKMTGEPARSSLLKHFYENFATENPEYFIVLESEIPAAFTPEPVSSMALID